MVQDVSYLNPFLITTRHHRACVVFYPQLLLSLFRCLVQQKLITDEVIKLRKEVKELQEKKQMVNVAVLILAALAKVNSRHPRILALPLAVISNRPLSVKKLSRLQKETKIKRWAKILAGLNLKAEMPVIAGAAGVPDNA